MKVKIHHFMSSLFVFSFFVPWEKNKPCPLPHFCTLKCIPSYRYVHFLGMHAWVGSESYMVELDFLMYIFKLRLLLPSEFKGWYPIQENMHNNKLYVNKLGFAYWEKVSYKLYWKWGDWNRQLYASACPYGKLMSSLQSLILSPLKSFVTKFQMLDLQGAPPHFPC